MLQVEELEPRNLLTDWSTIVVGQIAFGPPRPASQGIFVNPPIPNLPPMKPPQVFLVPELLPPPKEIK